MNVLHIFPKHINNKNESKTPTCAQEHEEIKCPKLIRFFCFLLKLLSELCIIIANVVCLKHTRSFLSFCLVQYTS